MTAPQLSPSRPSYSRHLRAALLTALVAVLALVPVFYMRHLDATRPPVVDLGTVAPVLYTDVTGVALSNADLAGKVTVVASLGTKPTPAQLAVLTPLTQWVESHLLYATANEQTPVRLVAISQDPVTLPALWRRIETHTATADDGLWAFVPSGREGDGPAVTVVDQRGVRRFHMLLDAPRLDELEPALSKAVINHYMHDYLARRTFFERQPGERAAAGFPSGH